MNLETEELLLMSIFSVTFCVTWDGLDLSERQSLSSIMKSLTSPSLFPRNHMKLWDTQVGTVVKNPPANAGDIRDLGLISGSGRSPGEGHGNPFQYSCLKNPMDRGVWKTTVYGVAKNQTC